jgi:preprotein translocase subunit SecG
MTQLMLILALLVCVILVLIVLIQNPKGGGLSSNFSSSSQLMGVQKTGDFLEKGTWGLAIFLMVLSMAISVATKGGVSSSTGTTDDRTKQLKTQPVQPTAPTFPGTATQPGSTPAVQQPAGNAPKPAK